MSLQDVSLSSLGSCIVSILIDVITNASDGSILRQIKKPKFVKPLFCKKLAIAYTLSSMNL